MEKLTEGDLSQFIGSENFYRHSLARNYVYTDGVKYLADHAGAYWLLDKIALHEPGVLDKEDFQVWKLKVQDQTADLSVSDGNDNHLYSEHIDYTNFPLPEIAIWAVRSEFGFTMLLPSEY